MRFGVNLRSCFAGKERPFSEPSTETDSDDLLMTSSEECTFNNHKFSHSDLKPFLLIDNIHITALELHNSKHALVEPSESFSLSHSFEQNDDACSSSTCTNVLTARKSDILDVQKAENLNSSYASIRFGKVGTLQHRIMLRRDGWQDTSPWHDVPLFQDDWVLSFVCTTPKGQWINIEAGENEKFTPLRIKRRNGKPTHYAQNLPCNYGIFPQTVIETDHAKQEPIQVFDIGSNNKRKSGDVYKVKPLAAFLVADGETAMSWQFVAIDVEDKKVDSVNGYKELKQSFAALLNDISSWLQSRNYIREGDVKSVIALGGKPVDRDSLVSIVDEAHSMWKLQYEAKELSKTPLDMFRSLSARELEKLWRFYTSKDCTDTMQLKEPVPDLSLKYDKAWEYVMSQEMHQTEKEMESFLDIDERLMSSVARSDREINRTLEFKKSQTEGSSQLRLPGRKKDRNIFRTWTEKIQTSTWNCATSPGDGDMCMKAPQVFSERHRIFELYDI